MKEKEMVSRQNNANHCFEICKKIGKNHPLYEKINKIYRKDQTEAFNLSINIERRDIIDPYQEDHNNDS